MKTTIQCKGSTPRTQELAKKLYAKGLSDRSGEWLSQEAFPDIAKLYPDESVIIRRAHAFRTMLEAISSEELSKGLYNIDECELIVGSIPLGSVGLGKVFPRYLTKEERRLSIMTSRDEESMFGHNSPDFNRVLQKGLDNIIAYSLEKINALAKDEKTCCRKIDFYNAVVICCQSVIEYAHRFAMLAEEKAGKCEDKTRKAELLEMARICKKVPAQPAGSFHEAVQSVWFTHLALHSTMDLMSLGRLDQVLQPFYEKSISNEEITHDKAIELLECFFIKGASRLNMTTNFLFKQDHLDFGTGLGTSPVFLDQIASANNFMQNIVIGGVDRNGNDATNDCTYLFLKACSNIGLPTPALTVRVHKKSPEKLLKAIANALNEGNNGLPILYNDETIIPGFLSSEVPLEEARDYVVDGCWEPILNATGDWTFGMINMLTVLECAMNSGCLISSNPSLLRGQKMSYSMYPTESIQTFDDLLTSVQSQINIFTDKVGLNIYDFYNVDGSVTPTPFFSALLGNCLDKGRDKTWGGADYNIGGIISIAIPNVANALYTIKKVVFEEKKYSLPELIEILRNNYEGYEDLRQYILKLPKFGNNEKEVDDLAAWLLDTAREAIYRTKELAEYIFLDKPSGCEARKVNSLKSLAGYEGLSMKERFGENFDILFTAGSGTFGQYASMGRGVAASADGRKRNEPVAPNCSPTSGSVKNGIGHIFSSVNRLHLDKFGAGVVVDLCIEQKADTSYLDSILDSFINLGGNILTLAVSKLETLQEAYEMCKQVRTGKEPIEKLAPYSSISVRVGGWNAPFISLPDEQQDDYMKRFLSK